MYYILTYDKCIINNYILVYISLYIIIYFIYIYIYTYINRIPYLLFLNAYVIKGYNSIQYYNLYQILYKPFLIYFH